MAKLGDRYVLPERARRAEGGFLHAAPIRQRARHGRHQSDGAQDRASAPPKASRSPSTAPRWPEVVGTISGDDTIFIATAGAREQRKLGERLRAIFGL